MAFLVAALTPSTAVTVSSAAGCGDGGAIYACAHTSTDSSAVDIEGTLKQYNPGYAPPRGSTRTSTGGGSASGGEGRSGVTWNCYDAGMTTRDTFCVDVREPSGHTPPPAPPPPPGELPAVVTVTDLASFVPAPATVITEPDGIGAKNLPLNTIATTHTHTLTGELFTHPVTVTFTPTGFQQDWGDGTTTRTPHGGTPWTTAHQPEFTPTPTSHAYTTKGTYPLRITALYTATVDFGPAGTRPVTGTITAPATTRDIRIVEIHTALVQHTCTEDPHGIGCPTPPPPH
jgi:hypothetical protein